MLRPRPTTKRLMNWHGLGIGCLLLAACGTSPSTSGDDPGGGPSGPGGPAVEAGTAYDGSDDPTDASTIDAHADGGSDAATSWRCGHGTFTQADAVTACAAPNNYLDGPGAAARYCDGATISGGSWEVFCSAGPLLVKLHLDGLTGTATHSGCMGFTERKVQSAWSE